MNVTKKLDGSSLRVSIEGRVDTATSPQLDAELMDSLDGITTLILDFTDVEYISSAGLRVLLRTQKTMEGQGEMKVTGANETIMDIFDVTGFTSILTFA